eukprot:scaffold1343_cov217-Pinguiococcus_pyrenoidosus.AAC.3
MSNTCVSLMGSALGSCSFLGGSAWFSDPRPCLSASFGCVGAGVGVAVFCTDRRAAPGFRLNSGTTREGGCIRSWGCIKLWLCIDAGCSPSIFLLAPQLWARDDRDRDSEGCPALERREKVRASDARIAEDAWCGMLSSWPRLPCDLKLGSDGMLPLCCSRARKGCMRIVSTVTRRSGSSWSSWLRKCRASSDTFCGGSYRARCAAFSVARMSFSSRFASTW